MPRWTTTSSPERCGTSTPLPSLNMISSGRCQPPAFLRSVGIFIFRAKLLLSRARLFLTLIRTDAHAPPGLAGDIGGNHEGMVTQLLQPRSHLVGVRAIHHGVDLNVEGLVADARGIGSRS